MTFLWIFLIGYAIYSLTMDLLYWVIRIHAWYRVRKIHRSWLPLT